MDGPEVGGSGANEMAQIEGGGGINREGTDSSSSSSEDSYGNDDDEEDSSNAQTTKKILRILRHGTRVQFSNCSRSGGETIEIRYFGSTKWIKIRLG